MKLISKKQFEKYSCVTFFVGYGLTETSPTGIRIPFAKPKPGSIGIIISNTEVQVGS